MQSARQLSRTGSAPDHRAALTGLQKLGRLEPGRRIRQVSAWVSESKLSRLAQGCWAGARQIRQPEGAEFMSLPLAADGDWPGLGQGPLALACQVQLLLGAHPAANQHI